MLSEKEIEHIASLARIALDVKEKKLFQKELSVILDYIEKLNKADTEKVEPLYQTTGLVNSAREDSHRNDFPSGEKLKERLVGQAPHKEKDFVKVKSVLSR